MCTTPSTSVEKKLEGSESKIVPLKKPDHHGEERPWTPDAHGSLSVEASKQKVSA